MNEVFVSFHILNISLVDFMLLWEIKDDWFLLFSFQEIEESVLVLNVICYHQNQLLFFQLLE